MSSGVQITESELLELVKFMERANELFHQRMNYSDAEEISKFTSDNCPLIEKYYYDVL